jgi:signal transduction histidine kinase
VARIRVLGETFNRMADQIQARTAELEASREKAQTALNDYLEVLGFVAHELKSPLAGAKMQLQLLDGGFAGEIPEAMKRPLAGLGRAVDYGNEVAQSFNQLSRAEGQGFVAKPREVEDFAAEVIRPAMADFEGAAAARAMTLALEGEAGGIRADPDLMRVVMEKQGLRHGAEGAGRVESGGPQRGRRRGAREHSEPLSEVLPRP